DVFQVTLNAGQAYDLNLDGTDTSAVFTLKDPKLRLLDSTGNQLARSDDIAGNNWSSQITDYQTATSGTYYLEASSSPGDHSYTTGSYQLRADAANVIVPPAGDQSLNATA